MSARPPLRQMPTARTAVLCAALAAAIAVGGGGSSAPASELILQLIVAAAAVAWVMLRRDGDPAIPPAALALAALVVVLPLAQLIPLPPTIWHALPGRSLEAASLDLVGQAGSWRPWTVSPSQTWAALLATLPVAFVACAAGTLDRDGRRAALATIAAMGFVSLLLGALQLADGTERTWRFYFDNPGYLNGFQANRNAQADLLLIALAAFAGLLLPQRGDRIAVATRAWLAAGGGIVLLLGTVLTGSRAGIAIAIPVLLLLIWPWRTRIMHAPRAALTVVVAVAVVGLALVPALASGGSLLQVADRFTWQRDVRQDLWRDTLPVLHSVWPAGSGIGTFRALFIAGEPLSSVDPTRPVRTHNDYMEFVLEGGIMAVMIAAAGFVLLGTMIVRARRVASPRDRPTVGFAFATFLVIALHSLVDYPLRSMALATLGAGAAGMLFAIVRDAGARTRSPLPGSELVRG